MDDGEIDHSSNPLLINPHRSTCGNYEELKNNKKCTHTHTCNPPGPAIPTHTHTCYHTHTQVFSPDEDDLEEEVKKLRYLNQQLLRRLEGQAALEAEILRLKSLLVDLRAKIDAELGVYPSKNLCSSNILQCGDLECFMGVVEVAGREGSCFPAVEDFQINQIADLSLNMESVDGVKVGGNMLSSASQANLLA